MRLIPLSISTLIVILLQIVCNTDASRQNSACPSTHSNYTLCGRDYFTCLNGQCINRNRYCNGAYDCSDQSDEKYCANRYSSSSCPATRPFQKCGHSSKCIPAEWICDGIQDCPSNDDEQNCKNKHLKKVNVDTARKAAIKWMHSEVKSEIAAEKWGTLVHKVAVALYLSDPGFSLTDNAIRKEMAYEISIQLLSKFALKKLRDVSSTDLASFVNALVVTCLNPRQFYGINIIEELRTRVEGHNYTNPYVFLALCNAGDKITKSDKKKMLETFYNEQRPFWTDVKAITVMALSCASKQSGSGIDSKVLRGLTSELKQQQFRNGSVENLQTTALVIQALYSAESDGDPENFDEGKALQQILDNQNTAGSFGSLMKNYYVLPVLSCKSLVNISSHHCGVTHKDEDRALHELVIKMVPKVRVHFSLWVGIHRDIERTIALRVPANTSFYGIMEIAAEIDNRYKFEYVVKNRKPYINAISEIYDDPENEQFWFPYALKHGKPFPVETSPADYFPEETGHLMMWFRSGSWTD